jgi:hypothetical protein
MPVITGEIWTWCDIMTIFESNRNCRVHHKSRLPTCKIFSLTLCSFHMSSFHHHHPVSAATKGSLADECDIYDLSKACEDYADKMAELKSLILSQSDSVAALKAMVSEVKKVKLAVPESQPGKASPQLKKALAEAKKITSAKGIESAEARIAWETVEEISAADNSGAIGAGLTADECLVDAAAEACEALEELNRVLAGNN